MYISKEHLASIKNHTFKSKGISVYIPTHQSSSSDGVQQDRTRLKNALKSIRQKYDDAETMAVVAQLDSLVENTEFWKYQDKGLAIFAAKDYVETLPVAAVLPEMFFVGDRFVVSPLYLIRSIKQDVYVLDVNLNKPRLLHIYGTVCEEVDADLPESLEAVTRRDEYRNQLQHQSAPQSVMGNAGMHGHTGSDAHEADIDKYLDKIAESTDAYLKENGTDAALILAGTDSRVGNIRPKVTHGHMSDTALEGSIEKDLPQDIYEKTVEIRDRLRKTKHEMMSENLRSTPPERHLFERMEIIEAAQSGRVDTLYVAALSEEGVIRLEKAQVSDIEPVVRAVLDQNGTVFASEGTNEKELEAICRY